MTATPIGFLVIAALLLCGCDDTVTSRYETRANAEADQLFERGWLPSIIPQSSYKITTKNDLDINVSEGEFAFDPSDAGDFIRHLSKGKGSTSYYYSEGNSTWIFEVNAEEGHCRYTMRFER